MSVRRQPKLISDSALHQFGSRAVGRPFALITTKLHIPTPRAELLRRPQLLARLDAALTSKLILLCAPAGFGKTSLASIWLHARGLRVGWVTLDASDNDPSHFWAYLLEALRSHVPALQEIHLPSAAEAQIEAALADVINALDTCTDDLVICLDDYHVITTESIQRGMRFLLAHAPARIHFLILTRSAPPFPLSRLNSRAELVEFRADDLTFSSEETAAYLQQQLDAPISAAELRTLMARTEGWPACLHLATLALKRHQQTRSMLEGLRGSHTAMFDYLASEVLSQLAPDVRRFLLHTALLERFCGDLCEALEPTGRAEAIIDELLHAGLFVIPLDERRGWFRYHQMFALMLRTHMREQNPEAWPVLHGRAAAWFRAQGLAAEAVHHALEAEAWHVAAEVIEQEAPAMLFTRGEVFTLIEWQQRFPADEVLRRPLLALYFARALLPLGRSEVAEQLADTIAERADRNDPTINGLLLAVRTRLAFGRDQLERCAELGAQARAIIQPQASLLYSDVTVNLASALYRQARYSDVIRLCEEVLTYGPTIGYNGNYWIAVGILATTYNIIGELSAGEQLCTQALTLAEQLVQSGGKRSPFLGHVLVARGFVRWEQYRLEEAAADFSAGITQLRPTGSARSLLIAGLQYAMIRSLLADQAATEAALEAATIWLREANSSQMLELYRATMAHIALLHDRRTDAANWTPPARSVESTANGLTVYMTEYSLMLQAWRALLFGQPEQAQRLQQPALTTAERGGRQVLYVEGLALYALSLAAQEQLAAALPVLARAVIASEPNRIRRPLIEKGEPMRRLLQALWNTDRIYPGLDRAYLHALLSAFGPTPDPSQPGIQALLTPREREVLRLLAAGTNNRRIAQTLIISEETVKTYLKKIYRKLDASNRLEAVARARMLGYL